MEKLLVAPLMGLHTGHVHVFPNMALLRRAKASKGLNMQSRMLRCGNSFSDTFSRHSVPNLDVSGEYRDIFRRFLPQRFLARKHSDEPIKSLNSANTERFLEQFRDIRSTSHLNQPACFVLLTAPPINVHADSSVLQKNETSSTF